MTTTPLAHGIVATPHPITADAGLEILAAGGTAIDAAVAAAFAHTVVTPASCGIAGYGGALVFYLADRDQVLALDYNSRAPAAAREDIFAVEQAADGGIRVPGFANNHGALAVDVPGTVSGLVLAQEQFGSLPLCQVLQPAIRAAREGFPVGASLADMIAENLAPRAMEFPEAYRLYSIDGRPPRAGEILRSPELAETLELIAEGGSAAFYEGELDRRIVDTVRSHGGILTVDDLAAYRARVVQAIHTGYRGHEVYTPPLGAGGLTVLQALRVLEGFDVRGRTSAPPAERGGQGRLPGAAHQVWRSVAVPGLRGERAGRRVDRAAAGRGCCRAEKARAGADRRPAAGGWDRPLLHRRPARERGLLDHHPRGSLRFPPGRARHRHHPWSRNLALRSPPRLARLDRSFQAATTQHVPGYRPEEGAPRPGAGCLGGAHHR